MELKKVLKGFLAFSAAIFIAQTSALAQVESPYELAVWGDFKDAAITHTFDDGTGNQFSKAIPMFNDRDFNLTLATVTSGGMFPGWDALKEAFADGHEIASHSVTHPQTVNEDEMRRSQEAIKQNVPGEMCISMIFPNCNVPNEQDVLRYYNTGRVCGSGPEGQTPNNFIRIASLIVGQGGAQTNLQSYAQSALDKKGWAVYLHHGVDGDHSWAYTSSSSLESHLNYLDENRDKFWVETFGNVVRYIKERDAARLEETSSDETSITLEVSDNLPDSIYNYPLSFRMPMPDGWDTAYVAQDEEELYSEIKMVDNASVLQFTAVPDGGEVVISSGVTGLKKSFSHNRGKKALKHWVENNVMNFSDSQNANKDRKSIYDVKGALKAVVKN